VGETPYRCGHQSLPAAEIVVHLPVVDTGRFGDGPNAHGSRADVGHRVGGRLDQGLLDGGVLLAR